MGVKVCLATVTAESLGARQTFTPTGVTTDFTFAAGYVPGYFDVYINGAKQIEASDYTSTDGSTFSILNGGVTTGDVIEGIAYKAFNAGTVTNASDLTVSGNLTVNGTTTFSGAVAAGTSVSFATTAFALSGTPDVAVRNLTGVAATFTGDVSAVDGTFTGDVSVRNLTGVAATFTGVVTYEDVTNIDSVGIVTARSGLDVTGGNVTIGTGSTVGFGSTAFFRDDAKAIFGDGEDLQIFHDGSNSIIQDSGTGELRLDSNSLRIRNAAGTETSAVFVQDGKVELRYDNVNKFETTTDGVVITGIATATSFSGDGSGLSGVGGENDITSCLFI